MIALATYDGKVVAEGVANDFSDAERQHLIEHEIAQETRRLDDLRNSSGSGLPPLKVKERVRDVMWDKAGVEKSAASLQSALEDFEQLRLDLLPGMRLSNQAKIANYEWLDAIDVVNMIDACELIVHSSLERKESRGPFFRKDFPLTDNGQWLAANVLKKSGNGLRFEKRAYETPYFPARFRHQRQS